MWNFLNFKLQFLLIGKRPPSYRAISYLITRTFASAPRHVTIISLRFVGLPHFVGAKKIISLQSIKFICGLRNETSYNMLLVRTLTNKDCKGPEMNYAEE